MNTIRTVSVKTAVLFRPETWKSLWTTLIRKLHRHHDNKDDKYNDNSDDGDDDDNDDGNDDDGNDDDSGDDNDSDNFPNIVMSYIKMTGLMSRFQKNSQFSNCRIAEPSKSLFLLI